MAKNIISLALLIISVFLAFKHGVDALKLKNTSESANMMDGLGINRSYIPAMGLFMIVVGLFLLFPKTFLPGNLLNAFSIVTIMALALNAGQLKIVWMEIPFLLLPLVMIWLKYPFKN